MVGIMAGYIKFEKDTLKLLINKPELLQLYVYCSNQAFGENTEKIIGQKRIIIPIGSFDKGRKQMASELNINEKTLYSRMTALCKLGFISRKNFSNITSIITVYKSSLSEGEVCNVQQAISNLSEDCQHTNTINTTNNNKYKHKGVYGFFKNVYINEAQFDSLVGLYFACPETQDNAEFYVKETIEYFDSKLESLNEEAWKPVKSQFAELRILIGVHVRKIREDSLRASRIASRVKKKQDNVKSFMSVPQDAHYKSIEVTKQEINSVNNVKRGSPLDLPRDKALEWYNNLPEVARNTYFAREVKNKYKTC